MRITCRNCGQSYSDRFDSCPVCGTPAGGENPADDFFDELMKEPDPTPAQETPPELPALDLPAEKTQTPVRRKGDGDTGNIHAFAFGEEDEDDATIRVPARPTPQPRQYYRDADESADPSYTPRYAKPRKRGDGVPVWLVVTISAVLGLALIIGGVSLAYALGFFDQKTPAQEPENPPAVRVDEPQQPDTTPDVTGDNTTVGNITLVDEDKPDDTFPVETIQPDGEPAPETPPVECTSLSLDNVDFTLAFRGDNYRLTATTEPEDAAQYVTWESSDPTVATVDEKGRVEGRSKGTVTITATCGEQTAKCIVRCEQLPAASTMINLSAEDITIANAGETAKLTLVDTLSDEELANLTWSSSKPEVASVDANGVVTAKTGGTTTIIAQSGERVGTCLVRCAFSGDGSYKISHSDVTMSYIGEYFNLYITHDGVKMTEVTWFTSDSNVASVNDMGVVTATGVGTATITTVVDGNSLQCIVRVKDGG